MKEERSESSDIDPACFQNALQNLRMSGQVGPVVSPRVFEAAQRMELIDPRGYLTDRFFRVAVRLLRGDSGDVKEDR